jgi:hypothetical protein
MSSTLFLAQKWLTGLRAGNAAYCQNDKGAGFNGHFSDRREQRPLVWFVFSKERRE